MKGQWFRTGDPESSAEAADASADSVMASQRAVAWIFENEEHPMTAIEVENKARMYALPYSDSRVRSCLSELVGLGVLERDGFIRRPGDARRRQLWRMKEVA